MYSWAQPYISGTSTADVGRLAIDAALSTVTTLAIANVAKNWGVPGSTAPFVFTTWLLLLTAMPMGTVFDPPSLRATVYAIVAAIFIVLVQAAFNTALSPVGIPALTFPYVLTMWIFLLPNTLSALLLTRPTE